MKTKRKKSLVGYAVIDNWKDSFFHGFDEILFPIILTKRSEKQDIKVCITIEEL